MRRLLAIVVSMLVLSAAAGAQSATSNPQLIARLNDDQRQSYQSWQDARAIFERQQDAYWSAIGARRAERRRKIGSGVRVSPDDFVMAQPPKYTGPPLRPDIAKIITELTPPGPDPSEITTLTEMLAAARQHYRFEPGVVAEREFKRRYAMEALAMGLSKDEVTRIYAFETGGRGTFDMQAGINPDTKQGRAISTAMGYAQLLAANSIGELAQYGDGFISRLGMLAVRRDMPADRSRELTAKIDSLRMMLRTARSVPREWSRHVEMARSSHGFGIHTINLDGDIGPWLQVIKLKGIKDTADQAGRPNLSPAELEMMNLAGPRTGLEMMEPVGRTAPTANFFSQAAYFRNTIVREKIGAELLAAIEHRMNENMLRPGSIEFATVFDEVMGKGREAMQEQRQQLMPVSSVRAPSPPIPVAAPRPAPVATPSSGPIPPMPVRAAPQVPALLPPEPMRADRPIAGPSGPRLQWAPAGSLGMNGGLPVGFPE